MSQVGGVKPFLLVDSHSHCIDLDFLSYINNPKHEWVMCIGTPYSTPLRQIGDSKDCKGLLNISLTKDMLDKKRNMCMQAQLRTYNIIPLVNVACLKSFTLTDKNKNDVADCGYHPPPPPTEAYC